MNSSQSSFWICLAAITEHLMLGLMLKFSLHGTSLLFGINNFDTLIVLHGVGFCLLKVFGLALARCKVSACCASHQVTLKIVCVIALLSLTQVTYDTRLLATKYSATSIAV